MPVTIPPEVIEAIVGLLLNHVPPEGVPVSVMELPTQTDAGPEITGIGDTANGKITKPAPTV